MCNNCYHKFGRLKKPWLCTHDKLYASNSNSFLKKQAGFAKVAIFQNTIREENNFLNKRSNNNNKKSHKMKKKKMFDLKNNFRLVVKFFL